MTGAAASSSLGLEALVAAALAEDVGSGDVTTAWTVDPNATGASRVVAKSDLVVAGLEAALATFRAVDAGLELTPRSRDGDPLAPGETALEVRGRLASILTAERTALNFLARLSGIATLTRRFVDLVGGTGARVLDTRKTTPGWRALEKRAVAAGGGANHRMGLYDYVLIKDNHIAAAGGIGVAVARVRQRNRSDLPVEVEVSDLAGLDEALSLGVTRVLLDNMDVPTLREAVRRARAHGGPAPELEASGNVSLTTVRDVAATGVDFISVGALTHSAPAADFSLRVDA